MASKGLKPSPQLQMTSQAGKSRSFAPSGGRSNSSTKTERGESGCSHCGNLKHIRKTCFKLHGYPEWWNDHKARKQKEATRGTGHVAMVNPEPQLSFAQLVDSKIGPTTNLDDHQGNNYYYKRSALLVFDKQKKNDWIVDSGATDHMTFFRKTLSKLRNQGELPFLMQMGSEYSHEGDHWAWY